VENDRIDEIIYEGDWQTFEPMVISENFDETVEVVSEKKNRKKHHFISLITIQLVICLLIAFVIFILKSMNGTAFSSLRFWYKENMRRTLFSTEVFEDIDLSSYFKATTDSLPATYDEI